MGGTLVMRRTLLAGLVLVIATGLTVLVGEFLDLEVEAVALLGVASGAIVGLVPDQNASRRLAAYVLGFVAAYVGFLVRAAATPDTSAGRAVFAAFVVALCVGAFAISGGRLPLWSALLGSASFAGAYEFTYTQAATRVLDTSVTSATALLLCVAVGFVVAATSQPAPRAVASERERDDKPTNDADGQHTNPIDDMMETSK
jgi:hypothetical protein